MSQSNGSGGGIGLVSVLTFIFILAKVFELGTVAQWSWWWVFSPLLISWGIVFLIFAIPFFVAGGVALGFFLLDAYESRKR